MVTYITITPIVLSQGEFLKFFGLPLMKRLSRYLVTSGIELCRRMWIHTIKDNASLSSRGLVASIQRSPESVVPLVLSQGEFHYFFASSHDEIIALSGHLGNRNMPPHVDTYAFLA